MCPAGLLLVVLATTSAGAGRSTVYLPSIPRDRAPTPTPAPLPGSWRVDRVGEEVRVAYGVPPSMPQYVALHTANSGYLRLNPGPGSSWGTSIVLPPVFWSGGQLHQGSSVNVSSRADGPDQLLDVSGALAGLTFTVTVRLSPPTPDGITAVVSATTSGSVTLDARPGEAFKPVMLSSMHVSATSWDASEAYVGCATYALPPERWILPSPVVAERFGLRGGTSSWQPNTPTIDVALDRPLPVTGYVTPSADPNDDNVGFWPASDSVLPSWRYTVQALRSPPDCSP